MFLLILFPNQMRFLLIIIFFFLLESCHKDNSLAPLPASSLPEKTGTVIGSVIPYEPNGELSKDASGFKVEVLGKNISSQTNGNTFVLQNVPTGFHYARISKVGYSDFIFKLKSEEGSIPSQPINDLSFGRDLSLRIYKKPICSITGLKSEINLNSNIRSNTFYELSVTLTGSSFTTLLGHSYKSYLYFSNSSDVSNENYLYSSYAYRPWLGNSSSTTNFESENYFLSTMNLTNKFQSGTTVYIKAYVFIEAFDTIGFYPSYYQNPQTGLYNYFGLGTPSQLYSFIMP